MTAVQPMCTHTHSFSHTHTEKEKQGSRENKNKKSNSGQIKGCLSFVSTFHLCIGLTKGAWLALLIHSPGNLGSGPKNKSTGKTGKTTPPSKQLGNHCSLKGRGAETSSVLVLSYAPISPDTHSFKATHGGQGSVSLLANLLLSLKQSLSPPLGLQRFSPFTETHES